MANRNLQVRIAATKKLVTLGFTDAELVIADGRNIQVPIRQVINACHDRRTLTLSYMSRKKGTGPMSLTNLSGVAEGADGDILDAWIETLLHFAYEGAGVKRGRRLKVVINPHGGTKKGAAVFKKTVEPIFRSAQCSLDVIHTTRGGHAYDIARTMALDYDAIVAVSGDGLIHEILNGFAHHEQPVKAFRIPLAPVPTGTGNALSLNLLGMEDGFDVSAAALNVVKGLPMNVDVFSLTQNGKRTISFMTQATGLLADLDIGTEHLRWMGEARFMYGLLRGVLQFKKCPVQLSYKAVELDKDRMFDNLQAQRFKAGNKNRAVPSSPPIPENEGNALPPLKYRPTDDDGWTILDDTFVYVFAGKGPYVGRDMMAFPVSLPDDGLIDILAQSASSRSDVLLSLGGAPKGEFYWNSSIHYIKANAYRIKPLAPKGSLAVDGEIFPFEEFQVEAHQGLATLLSPYGRYAAEFAPRPKRKATS